MRLVSLVAGQPRDGLEIPDARSLRIDACDDGRVVVRQHRAAPHVVCGAGDVTRAVVIASGQLPGRPPVPAPPAFGSFGEVLALFSGTRPLLAVPLVLVGPGHAADEAELRRLARVEEFAGILGVPLEPATDTEAALVAGQRDVWVQGAAGAALRRRAWVHAACLAAILGGTFVTHLLVDHSFRSVSTAAALAGLATVVLLGCLTAGQWGLQSAFRRWVVNPPLHPDRHLVPNRLDGSWPRALRTATLQVGPDDLVHSQGGSERWLPGPNAGGVVACVIAPDGLHFLDKGDRVLGAVAPTAWMGGDGDELRRACEAAGLDYKESKHLLASPSPLPTTQAWRPRYSFATLGASSVGVGMVLAMSPLSSIVAAILVMATLLFSPALDVTPFAAVVAALAGVLALVNIWLHVRPSRWERQQRSMS